jgi:hypothetical protein
MKKRRKSFDPPNNNKFEGNIIGMKRKKEKKNPPRIDKFEKEHNWHERKIILILQN